MSEAEAVPEVGKSGLFARTATGLVRGVPPRSSLIINFIPGHPTQTMVAVLLFALAVGAGGNPFLAILIVIPMSLAFSYAFGLLTQMIPRSGGDYMLVSRVMHPSIGWMSVFCMTTAGLLSNAFFGLAVMTAGIIPLCIAVGLIADWPGLVLWAQDAGDEQGLADLLRPCHVRLFERDPAVGLADATPDPEHLLLDGHRLARNRHDRDAAPVEGPLREQVQQLRGGLHQQTGRVSEYDRNGGKSRCRGRSELLVQSDDPDGRRLRDDGDLQLLVDLCRGRAASGLDDEDRTQHGARRHHSAHRRGNLHGDLLQDVRQRVPSRRERRWPAGRDPGTGYDVLLPERDQCRQCGLHVRDLPPLHRLLAVDHLHLEPAADAGDLRDVVRRRAAQGGDPGQPVRLPLAGSSDRDADVFRRVHLRRL